MTYSNAPKITACSLALAGFAVALLSGLGADLPAYEILGRGVISLFACYIVGQIIGATGLKAVEDAAESFQRNNPIPTAGGEAAQIQPGSTTSSGGATESAAA